MLLTRTTGDARALCCSFDQVIDLVITDPPYPSLRRHRAVGTTTRLKTHENMGYMALEEIMGVFTALALRMRPGGYLVAVVDAWTWLGLAMVDEVDDLAVAKGATAPKGLSGLWWRNPWVWIKTTKDARKLFGGTGYHGRYTSEMIIILQKPGKARQEIRDGLKKQLNVVFAPRVKNRNAYPAQKPQVLGRQLLEIFSASGDLVLDPFAGSGCWLINAAAERDQSLHLWDKEPINISTSGDWP